MTSSLGSNNPIGTASGFVVPHKINLYSPYHIKQQTQTVTDRQIMYKTDKMERQKDIIHTMKRYHASVRVIYSHIM